MGKYKTIVKEDTPRLTIKFRVDDNGREQYEWGVSGNIPLIDLISAISRTIVELTLIPINVQALTVHDKLCPNPELVIVHDEAREFHWFLHPEASHGILGMLELIKATIVAGTMARQVAQQGLILGVDGRPMPR